MKQLLDRLIRERSGATAIEYGLIAALISVVLIATVSSLGSNMKTKFGSVSTAISNAR